MGRDGFIKIVQTIEPEVFWEVGKSTGYSAWLRSLKGRTCKTVHIETEQSCYCLDRLIVRGESPPDLIRIDMEGTEKRVIIGARNLLEQYSPVLLIKTNPSDLSQYDLSQYDLSQYLGAMGYRSSRLDRDTLLFVSVYF